jgi:hypothetical protein
MGVEIEGLNQAAKTRGFTDTFTSLKEELEAGLLTFWGIADGILRDSGIRLMSPPASYVSLENNFFSAMFLYSYYRTTIPKDRRILYVAVNQCLRGMVTGCDNILDNEYKKTLDTDLPPHAVKFRSVLDILVSDRVLFSLVYQYFKNRETASEEILNASAASLRALTRSGVQEASEESRILVRLRPEEVLGKIHHYKTGLLFQSPWAVPMVIERFDEADTAATTRALYQIGMGCQILDDMNDLASDIEARRQNYVASLIAWDEKNRPSTPLNLDGILSGCKSPENLLCCFPEAEKTARDRALAYLNDGCRALFDREHDFMKDMAIDFLIRRINVERFFRDR